MFKAAGYSEDSLQGEKQKLSYSSKEDMAAAASGRKFYNESH